MSAGVYGLCAALGWGSADFIARFTGRAIGHHQSLLGMLSVGAIVMSLIIFLFDVPFVYTASGWWLLLLTGIGTMVATLLLYQGLTRGPVTIVAPIVGSFPIFNVIFALLQGSRPGILQWIAMFTVFSGVWLIACAASQYESQPGYNRRHLNRTIIIALASSFGFGITVTAAQTAGLIYGELQTVCIARWISLFSLGLIFVWKRQMPVITPSCWPLIGVQGLMDTGAYVALAWSAHTDNAEIAAVVSSGFSLVTVILARLFLKEKMNRTQWCGVICIIAGVVALTSFA